MFNGVHCCCALGSRIDHPIAEVEERGKIATAEIAVFVNGGGKHGAAVGAKPGRIVGSSTEKRDAIGSSTDDHDRFSPLDIPKGSSPQKRVGFQQLLNALFQASFSLKAHAPELFAGNDVVALIGVGAYFGADNMKFGNERLHF